MRHAVLAAAVAFNPSHAWVRLPIVGVARGAARVVMAFLDRQRALSDRDHPGE